MKKIGIITIERCDNFGAELQAYALGAKLRGMGYDAENIDYLFYKNCRHVKGKGEKPTFRLSMVNRVKEMIYPILHGKVGVKPKFNDWFEANVKHGPCYESVESLYKSPPKYDVYMVGSDQVWNPRTATNILPYFLDFAPEGSKCVSYASSFGVSHLPDYVYLIYRELLGRFSHIGLREKQAAEIVGRMELKAEVKHVLDPTLLLTADEWEEVAIKYEDAPEKYLLLYDLIADEETTRKAREWASELGVPVVRIGDLDIGPGEFVWLFAHAVAVVTNSFHGTAFAVNFGRQFESMIPRRMANGSRITSLLNAIKEKSLEELRKESVDFLRRSVEGVQKLEPRKQLGVKPKKCLAVWNKDARVREESTSGGAFTALAREVIRNGGVVYGAAFDRDFHYVRHVAADTPEALGPIRKSKYVWSDAGEAIKSAVGELKAGRRVMFTGTPCQCHAMRQAAKDVGGGLLTVDFVCHGTPPSEAFAEYARGLEKKYGGKLTRYEFRNKDKGWNCQNIVYEFDTGVTKRVIPWLDEYFHAFSVNANLRPGCYSCPFANLNRVSDITIGDCWRVAASHPQYDDNRGTSLVLVNSEAGDQAWSAVREQFDGGEYPLELAEKRNHALMQPATRTSLTNYMTKLRLFNYVLRYYAKKLGWFYFKRCQ